jgi:hypothetical protein
MKPGLEKEIIFGTYPMLESSKMITPTGNINTALKIF